MERIAECACGQLSVTIEGDPEFHGVCSCFACQRMTGSAFDYSGYWLKSAVKMISGDHISWRRSSDSGRWLESNFCPVCGSTIFGYAEWAPDKIFLTIGAFADPEFPPPEYAVWNKNKHSWVEIPKSCRSTDEQEV